MKRKEQFCQYLLSWYDENKRCLPWRHTDDPYLIWVCEIMAQQTRISFLLDYYNRFTKQFPDVQSLANAEEADVLKAWEGLGYYSRARNLWKAAQKVVLDFNGALPKTKKELLSLPGIGEYTAGAIMSIAYGIPTPAVDGNVLRVFSRLENSDSDISLPQTRRATANLVETVMPKGRAGGFTQALMELGALICIPKNPNCIHCPVSELCEAYIIGTQKELPKKSPKSSPKPINKTILIIQNSQSEILMRQRSEKLLLGLWEFYSLDEFVNEEDISTHLQSLGLTAYEIKPLGTAKHIFTHLIWQMRGYICKSENQNAPHGYRWIGKFEFETLAIPAALRFYVQKVLNDN
ncbi:MAG: A/G-specific adenine glycosylase [Oscillospiraceae bacterium]|nr:A/G-specific adenine glycosylase [Oscillospiraceae bacterium]